MEVTTDFTTWGMFARATVGVTLFVIIVVIAPVWCLTLIVDKWMQYGRTCTKACGSDHNFECATTIRHRSSMQISDVNITRCIDVVLPIFKVPASTRGVPKAMETAWPTDYEEPLTVKLTAHGEVRTRQTGMAQIWRSIVQIAGALNAAGFNNTGLVMNIGVPTLDLSGGSQA